MVPRRVFAMLPLLLSTSAGADTLPTEISRLRAWSDDQYARLVLDARQLGRRYSEEDVASGARRHYEEVRAQYCDAVPTSLSPGLPTDCGRTDLPIP
jgi:hypothetical protein